LTSNLSQAGRLLARDATATFTLAYSHTNLVIHGIRTATNTRADPKSSRNTSLAFQYIFQPIAVEVLSPIKVSTYCLQGDRHRMISVHKDVMQKHFFLVSKDLSKLSSSNSISSYFKFLQGRSSWPEDHAVFLFLQSLVHCLHMHHVIIQSNFRKINILKITVIICAYFNDTTNDPARHN
jgi:hypothetical protein